jgi:hypothetical protein
MAVSLVFIYPVHEHDMMELQTAPKYGSVLRPEEPEYLLITKCVTCERLTNKFR